MMDLINSIKKPADSLDISLEQIVMKDNIYKGQFFCEVNNVMVGDKPYVLKTIHKHQMQHNQLPAECQSAYNQISVLYHLRQPNIIRLCWHYQDAKSIYLLLEHGGRTLSAHIQQRKLDSSLLKSIFRQIVLGVHAIHEAGFIHRDITPENILLQKGKTVKIIDFGYTKRKNNRNTEIGVQEYMAPEIYEEHSYDFKADIWSLGIVLYEMYHCNPPFLAPEKKIFVLLRSQLKYQLSPNMPSQAVDLLKKLLVINPDHRLTTSQILKHPFVRLPEEEDDLEAFVRNGETGNSQKTEKVRASWKEESELSVSEMEKQLLFKISNSYQAFLEEKNLLCQIIQKQKLQIEKTIAEVNAKYMSQ